MLSVFQRLKKHFSSNVLTDSNIKELPYNPNPYNYKEPYINKEDVVIDEVITETLIERFFDEFEKDLLYRNEDDFFDKLNSYLNKEGLSISFRESNKLDAYISKKTLYIGIPNNPNIRDLAYVILHELSHYITNKSSNGKLKEYLNEPNYNDVDLRNIREVEKELKYFLTPGELANWAFTLSIYFYEESDNTANDLYRRLKISIGENLFDFQNNSDYRKIPDNLKIFYHIVNYLKIYNKFSNNKNQKREFKNMMMKLVHLIDKYVKRLKKYSVEY